MISIPHSTSNAALLAFKKKVDDHSTAIESRLKVLLRKSSGKRKDYVAHLLQISGKLLTMSPSVLEREKRIFNNIIHSTDIKKKAYKSFCKSILTALQYETKREKFYPHYFHTIGIKACVYCNSQLTVSAEVKKKGKNKVELVGKFQVDHYLAKSEYPCFSVSLFNLYPCCASCNNTKSNNHVDFQLYSASNITAKSLYKFIIDPQSVTNYFLSGNFDDIKISFKEPPKKKAKQSFVETFGIDGIYNTQKDLAEEIIIKAQIYTPSFRKGLEKQFKALFPRPGFIERMILGNYYLEKDMHKRPFSKFSMDIARDLGLIS